MPRPNGRFLSVPSPSLSQIKSFVAELFFCYSGFLFGRGLQAVAGGQREMGNSSENAAFRRGE